MTELLSKVKNSEYNDNLIKNIKATKQQITSYEKEIRKIKSKLKSNEIKINRENKEPNIKLKRIAYDYNAKKNEYNALLGKYEKMRTTEENNVKRINELKERKEGLEKNAQELYGITEIIDVKEILRKKEIKEKNKDKLEKDLLIMENSIKTLKAKYQLLFEKNENEINKLKQKKLELLKELQIQESLFGFGDKTIKDIYGNEILGDVKSNQQRVDEINKEISYNNVNDEILNNGNKENEGEINNNKINEKMNSIEKEREKENEIEDNLLEEKIKNTPQDNSDNIANNNNNLVDDNNQEKKNEDNNNNNNNNNENKYTLPPIKKPNRIESAVKRKPFDFKLGKSQVTSNDNSLNNNNINDNKKINDNNYNTINEEIKEDQSLNNKNEKIEEKEEKEEKNNKKKVINY